MNPWIFHCALARVTTELAESTRQRKKSLGPRRESNPRPLDLNIVSIPTELRTRTGASRGWLWYKPTTSEFDHRTLLYRLSYELGREQVVGEYSTNRRPPNLITERYSTDWATKPDESKVVGEYGTNRRPPNLITERYSTDWATKPDESKVVGEYGTNRRRPNLITERYSTDWATNSDGSKSWVNMVQTDDLRIWSPNVTLPTELRSRTGASRGWIWYKPTTSEFDHRTLLYRLSYEARREQSRGWIWYKPTTTEFDHRTLLYRLSYELGREQVVGEYGTNRRPPNLITERYSTDWATKSDGSKSWVNMVQTDDLRIWSPNVTLPTELWDQMGASRGDCGGNCGSVNVKGTRPQRLIAQILKQGQKCKMYSVYLPMLGTRRCHTSPRLHSK